MPTLVSLAILLTVSATQQVFAQNPDDMQKVKNVTVWFWSGLHWQDQTGEVFVDTSTNRKWIKVHHALTIQRGPVLSNRDYKKDGVGQKRRWRYLMDGDNGITYYFNID